MYKRQAQLDRLVFGQVAEVGDLDLTVGVFVDRQGVDHPHGVALAEPLQLGGPQGLLDGGQPGPDGGQVEPDADPPPGPAVDLGRVGPAGAAA